MAYQKLDTSDLFNESAPAVAQITFTPKALTHFKTQLEKKPEHCLRISVKPSGCTGYKYELEMVETPKEDDHIIQADEDFKVYIAQKAIPMLQGTEIDYVLKGINKELVFNNPNVKDMCGCGESFSV